MIQLARSTSMRTRNAGSSRTWIAAPNSPRCLDNRCSALWERTSPRACGGCKARREHVDLNHVMTSGVIDWVPAFMPPCTRGLISPARWQPLPRTSASYLHASSPQLVSSCGLCPVCDCASSSTVVPILQACTRSARVGCRVRVMLALLVPDRLSRRSAEYLC